MRYAEMCGKARHRLRESRLSAQDILFFSSQECIYMSWRLHEIEKRRSQTRGGLQRCGAFTACRRSALVKRQQLLLCTVPPLIGTLPTEGYEV